jgi:hypothetical protein
VIDTALQAPAPVDAPAPDAPAPDAPAPDAPAPDAPAPDAPAVVDTALQTPAPADAPIDGTAVDAANWTPADPAAAPQPQGWALHMAPQAPIPAPTDDQLPVPAPAPDPAPAPAPDPLAPLNAVTLPGPVLDAANQAMTTGAVPAVPAAVPHLSSPDNLPPGTTEDPADPVARPNLGYLKELWHAVQTQDISGNDALLALAQRPMSSPDPGQSGPIDPNAPIMPGAPGPGDAPGPAPAPAPAPSP